MKLSLSGRLHDVTLTLSPGYGGLRDELKVRCKACSSQKIVVRPLVQEQQRAESDTGDAGH